MTTPWFKGVSSNTSCHAMLNDQPRGSTAIQRIESSQLTMFSNRMLPPESKITDMIRGSEAFITQRKRLCSALDVRNLVIEDFNQNRLSRWRKPSMLMKYILTVTTIVLDTATLNTVKVWQQFLILLLTAITSERDDSSKLLPILVTSRLNQCVRPGGSYQ